MFTNGTNWWWVSSCDKPSYEVSTEEYKLVNHTFKYPGVTTWNDISMTIVDATGQAESLVRSLLDGGYDTTGNQDGLSKGNLSNALSFNGGDVKIQQLDDQGTAVETWTLTNPFIKSTNFGSLDYSSDELVKLELVISYDYAILEQTNEVKIE